MRGKIKNFLVVFLASLMFLPSATGCNDRKEKWGNCLVYRDANICLSQNNKLIMHKGDVYKLGGSTEIDFQLLESRFSCGQIVATNDIKIYPKTSQNNPEYEKCEKCFSK